MRNLIPHDGLADEIEIRLADWRGGPIGRLLIQRVGIGSRHFNDDWHDQQAGGDEGNPPREQTTGPASRAAGLVLVCWPGGPHAGILPREGLTG